MGDTLRYAQKVKLVEMEPRGDLTSTGYALANRGKEYLVLQPGKTSDPFTVTLAAGVYTVQWYSVDTRKTARAGKVTVGSPAPIRFAAPFAAAGPAVLYLKQVRR